MATHNQGKSLELFFIDGRPDGILTAEVFGWTGHILVTPRTQIVKALRRKEMSYTGVYILFGDVEGGHQIYIGESENISYRIRNHDSNKDWWSSVAIIVSTGDSLHKAHAKYLESRLVSEAKNTGQSMLENGNVPTLPSLTEAGQSNMESFLEHILMVLPALRIDSFLRKTRPSLSNAAGIIEKSTNPVFEINSTKLGLKAKAELENGEFVVQAGSIARGKWEGGENNNNYKKLFLDLIAQGVLKKDNGHNKFVNNYAFSSPSAAGAIIYGRACNGQTSWKLNGGNKTYRDWEQNILLDSEDM